MPAPPPTKPTMPTQLFGYDVVDLIGGGAGSSIYVVADPKSGQLYALKHVVPTEPKHQRFVEQLETEYRVSRGFRHPGLRRAVDYKVKKRLFGGVAQAALVMELVDGVPLERDLPDGVPAVVDVFLKVAAALAEVHDQKLLHCDLKPGNIMRDPAGRVKLIDFGQACRAGTTKERVQGTPDFIAPEQVRCRVLEYTTDVYNLGATLYWALTGGRKVPTLFTVGKGDRDIVREQKFPSPHELNPAVPAALGELVMDCVRMSPDYRPQTMQEVIGRLAPFGSDRRETASGGA